MRIIALLLFLIVQSVYAENIHKWDDKFSFDQDSIVVYKQPTRVKYVIYMTNPTLQLQKVRSVASQTVNCENSTYYFNFVYAENLKDKRKIHDVNITGWPSRINPQDVEKYSIQYFIMDLYCPRAKA